MVWPDFAGAAAQLLRTRRKGAGRSFCDRKSVLSLGARRIAAADDLAGHGRHRNREPGRDHRSLFSGGARNPTRHAAAPGDPAHLSLPCRPDLYSARYGTAANWRIAIGRDVSHFERAGLRLRHRGHYHHGRRWAFGLPRGVEALEVEALAGGAAVHSTDL